MSWLLLTRGPRSAGAEQLMLLRAKDVVFWIFFKLPHADWALPCALLPCLGLVTLIQSNIFSPKLLQLLPSLFWLVEIGEASSTSFLPQTPSPPQRA